MSGAPRLFAAKEWALRRFGDCARLINGRAYSQEELLESGTPVLRIQNLNGGDRWYYSDLSLPEEKYCNSGDLLFAWSASFGPYRFNGPRSIFHYHIWRVIPGPELDAAFAFHLLEWITAGIKSAAHGVAMLHMTKAGMEAWPVAIPPLEEQLRIAEVLDRAEALRAKRRAALALLDTLGQSIFLALFGDPATNQHDWPEYPLAAVVEGGTIVTYGIVQAGDEYPGGVPYIRTGDIVGGEIAQGELRHTDPAIAQKFARSRVRPGDIVMSIRATVGTTALVPAELNGANLTQGTARIAPGREVDGLYLLHFLRSLATQRWISRQIKGATFREITLARLRELPVLAPPLTLQREFAARVSAVEKLKAAHRASLAQLDALFASLQHRAFRGEL